MAAGDLNASAQAAMDLAESAMMLRSAKGEDDQADAARKLAAASQAAAARIEAEDRSPLGHVMAGMAKAASKIKLLARLTAIIPVVGPTAGGLLHGLSQVCEAAARFRAGGKEALRLMSRIAQVTEGILVRHRYVGPDQAERVSSVQQDVEGVLKTAQLKLVEVYGKDEALSRAKRAYDALFSGKDSVTFDHLEQQLRESMTWHDNLIQTIQIEIV